MRAVARLLTITILVLALASTASGVAENNILTVSAELPPYLSVSYERVGWSLLDLEGGVGARLRIDPYAQEVVSFTPFVILGLYQRTRSIWVELTIPEGALPVIGESPSFISVGGEYRW